MRERNLVRLAGVRDAHRRGVTLLAGTDRAPGAVLHWELELLTRAGIPPLEVLRIATQQAAEAVGAEDDLGTLEVGKLADIVLLDANPLEDIKNTQAIWRVLKGGWVLRDVQWGREKNPRRPVASHQRFVETLKHVDTVDPMGRLRCILILARYTGRRESAICHLRASDFLRDKTAIRDTLASMGQERIRPSTCRTEPSGGARPRTRWAMRR